VPLVVPLRTGTVTEPVRVTGPSLLAALGWLPLLVKQPNVPEASAERPKVASEMFPRPAALNDALNVTEFVVELTDSVGVPMKCGLVADATVAVNPTARRPAMRGMATRNFLDIGSSPFL